MDKFGVSWLKEPIKAIQRSYIRFWGSPIRPGDKSFFDQRGAINIAKGQKSISDNGGGGYTPTDPIALYRPAGGKFVDAQKAMQSNFGWVYACVKAISDEMANIDFRLYGINKKGEHEELDEHPVLDLLDSVNENQTGPEFKKVLASHLELTGNAFIYLIGVKDFDTEPTAMYLLNPGSTKIFLDKTTFPYKVVRYEMIDDNRKFIFKPHEIVHLKYPDPNDAISGLGTVQGIAEWIDNDNYAMEFNRQFFKNGARMSGVFETDMSSIEQTQRLKIAFEEQFQGVKNAYKSMIMPKGVKWVPTQASAKDMDFTALLDMTSQRILAGFRVSKTILGTAESDTNRATAETADYVFAKRNIKPKMEIIISYLNEFLIPRFGDNIYLSFNDPVPEDKAFRTTEMVSAVAGKQVITQNEARQEFMGLGPIEGGDTIDTASGTANPLELKPNGEPKAVKKFIRAAKVKEKSKRNSIKFKTQFSRNKDRRKTMASSLAEVIAKYVSEAKKKTVVDMTDDEYLSVVYIHSKARMNDYEPKIREEMQKFARRQEKEVQANLGNAIKSYVLLSKKDIVVSKLFNFDEWVNILVDMVTPLAAKLYGEEAHAALVNLAMKPFDVLADPAAQKALEKRMSLLANSYNQTLLDALESKLNEGLANGASLSELSTSVSDIYAWSETYQAERVSKTETVALSNMANKEAWKQAGTVKTVKWYTSQKDNVCPLCQAMAGKVIEIDDNFFDKGDKITGTDGTTMDADYSAIGGPPLHPNCGCLIRPNSFKPLT